MKKLIIPAILLSLFSCSKTPPLPHVGVIEKKVYDIPFKSQVSLQVYLKDTTATTTKEQLNGLLDSLITECRYTTVKYHDAPTHIFIYIYKTVDEFKAGGENWVAMFQKTNEDEEKTIKPIE